MYILARDSFNDFKSSARKYLSFELIYTFLSSFLFVPLLTYIFNHMLKLMGTGSLLNAEVYQFGLSFTGMTGIFLIGFLAVAILFVEFGVLIIIAQKTYFGQPILIAEACVTALNQLPKLLGLGFFQLSFLLLLVIPLIDSSTLPPVLDYNLVIILTNILHESAISIMIYAGVLLAIVYLFFRWIFTLHYIFLEDMSIREAMQQSWQITKHNPLRVPIYLFLMNLLIFTAGFLFMHFITYTAEWIDTKIIGDFIGNYLLTFSSYIAMILSLFFIPINLIILTRLFYMFRHKHGQRVEDRLILQAGQRVSMVEKVITRFFSKRKYTLISAVILGLTAMFIINNTVNESIVYLKWDVAVASHRGDWQHAPENTLTSVRSAIEKGADAVEVDVMMTKDGVLVLSHDFDLQRTAGISALISDLTYAEISRIDIGYIDAEEGLLMEKIPTLDEVLEEVQQSETKLIIDLKTVDPDKVFAERVARLIEKYEVEHLAYVQSFNYDLLHMIRETNTEIKIGQILYLSAGDLTNLDVDFYTIRESMLTERFIQQARKQNREVWVWTVNLERNMKEVLKYDIDGIITDYPEKVQHLLELG